MMMPEPKDATAFTEQANQAILGHEHLDWEDRQDWEDAQKGFIAKLDPPVINDADGRPIWDLNEYSFLGEESAPLCVNPSLWRQARLNMFHGLFKVVDHIYQVRGYDLSVMSIIETDTGYIVIDPLISAETAGASMELAYEHLGKKPVVAVIYTHSHVDHWGGVRGVVSEADVEAGKVMVIAPEGFTEAAVSENVIAGNVMSRRAYYMYGSLLPKGPRGQVDAGLGKNISTGTITLIEPTITIAETPTELEVDGVKIVFQNTPDTEAPSEMQFYFPQFSALCMAENCTHNLHNLYTLRGAQVRDAKNWAHYINEAIELFADKTDVVFASHHWPVWGRDRCVEFLSKQRDMYKYLHDEVLRLANHGLTMLEIA
jgi:alkyl sulfatase BDS1-like metallo-beta-lactamase superfamily hydrolase